MNRFPVLSNANATGAFNPVLMKLLFTVPRTPGELNVILLIVPEPLAEYMLPAASKTSQSGRAPTVAKLVTT